jgi:hypothetical protein
MSLAQSGASSVWRRYHRIEPTVDDPKGAGADPSQFGKLKQWKAADARVTVTLFALEGGMARVNAVAGGGAHRKTYQTLQEANVTFEALVMDLERIYASP